MPATHFVSLHTRRYGIVLLAMALVAPALGFAQAAASKVEIIGYSHRPVQAALKPLREWLATQGAAVKLIEIDLDSPQAGERIRALGVKGHFPVVVLINGQFRHTLLGGRAVELVGLPAAGVQPAGKGWTLDDVKAVLAR